MVLVHHPIGFTRLFSLLGSPIQNHYLFASLLNSIFHHSFRLPSLMPTNMLDHQTFFIANLSALARSSSICLFSSVKEVNTASIFLNTWKILWMSIADSFISFKCWDEFINKHVWFRISFPTFCCQMFQELNIRWLKFYTSRKARPLWANLAVINQVMTIWAFAGCPTIFDSILSRGTGISHFLCKSSATDKPRASHIQSSHSRKEIL
nr:hypothetical protein Iba_scaffold5767CG0430 [Ipomoea batatas]